jgi:hypothetical protein
MDDIELVYNGQTLRDATRTLASFGMTTETEAVQMDRWGYFGLSFMLEISIDD